MDVTFWVGFDPREAAAFAITRHTLKRNIPRHWPVHGLILGDLQRSGLYTRPISWKAGVDRNIMWDDISDAPMSTQHVNARFLVPHLTNKGWGAFLDGDMAVVGNMGKMVESLDPKYAVYCVKHKHAPINTTKMDGQLQVIYPRKNWTSFILFNCEHPANKSLTLEAINSLPGRDLHRLCWLDDEEIGELDPSWNFLVGYSDPNVTPNLIHWTEGTPDMRGHENTAFASLWGQELENWAR